MKNAISNTSARRLTVALFILFAAEGIQADLPALPGPLDDTLGNWYNLGRVSGNKTYTNGLFSYIRDGLALIDMYHFSRGNDHIEVGVSTLSLLAVYENGGGFLSMLPGIDIDAAPSPGNRLTATISSANLFFAVGGEPYSGFEDPLNFANSYSWDFLSRRGVIQVDPDQYENSFYFGPQLNAGQVRTHVDIAHSLQFDSDVYPRYFNSNGYIRAGILDNLSFTGICSYHHTSVYQPGYDPYYYDYRDAEIETLDSLAASGFFQIRTSMMTGMLGYTFNRNSSAHNTSPYMDRYSFKTFRNSIYSDFSIITGNHVSSLAEVNGNWDGYFSPLLGNRQFLAHLHPEMEFIRYPSRIEPFFTLDHNLNYGCSPWLTIGEKGDLRAARQSTVVMDFSLTATLSNIPLRTRGPEQVSKFEYVFGYWPRKGEFRIDAEAKLPLPTRSLYHLPTTSIIRSVSNNVLNRLYNFNRLEVFSNTSISGYNQSALEDYDHRLKITFGVASSCILSNDFMIKEATSYQYIYNENGYSWSDENRNYLFTDQIGVHCGNTDKFLHTLHIGLYWQTAVMTSGRDRFDFMLSYLFTAGF